MTIGIKDSLKLFILSVMSCCAVFVCTLFLNYQSDLIAVKEQITTEAAEKMFDAMKSSSVMVCAACGGGLLVTSVVMMIFYVKHYIDVHKKELGILKAIGYPRMKIASGFWTFGLSVMLGALPGFGAAFIVMPGFYDVQNKDSIIPEVKMTFHIYLLLLLVVLPAVFFGALAIIYAFFRLRTPVLLLIKDNYAGKRRERHLRTNEDATFIKTLTSTTVRSRKSLIFFVVFASFCFSAMTQLSLGVRELPDVDDMMSVILLVVGLVLAFVTLFLAITTVISANSKTIAMMKVFGYPQRDCRRTILDGYRPLSYIGFAVGTVYQYFMIQLIIRIVFRDYENVPEYSFSVSSMFISLGAFIIVYEALMLFYSGKIKRISLKEIMLE